MSLATSLDETPVFIRSGDADLFGILTAPTTAPNGAAILLLLGGLYTLSINRNRVTVEAARRFASLGYHVLRLDLHGVGESTGVVESFDIDHPFYTDVLAATDWLKNRAIDEVVFVGHCYGGRTFLAATEHLPPVRGIALFSIPVVRFDRAEFEGRRKSKLPLKLLLAKAFTFNVLRGLFSRRRRRFYGATARAKLRSIRGLDSIHERSNISPDLIRQLRGLADARTPVLLVQGNDDYGKEFERVRSPEIDKIIARPHACIEFRSVRDVKLHGMPSLEAQKIALNLLEEWLVSLDPLRARDNSGSGSRVEG